MTVKPYNLTSVAWPQEIPHSVRRTFDLLVAQVQELRNQIEANRARMRVEAFNAAHFAGANGQTWTATGAQVSRNSYARFDDVLLWSFQLSASTVGGTPDPSLVLTLPGGYRCARGAADTPGVPAGAQVFPVFASDAGGATEIAQGIATPGSTNIVIQLLSGANWTSGADTAIAFTCWIDVE